MKKTIAILLALCLCVGLCACRDDVSIQDDVSTQTEESKSLLTEGQEKAVRGSASSHALLDFNYELVDITFNTLDDDGTYITVSGSVTFADQNGSKYYGDYSAVLVDAEAEDEYVVKQWDLGKLMTEDGLPVDYYKQLYDYVVREGYYEDGISYVYTTAAANEDLMLIAENGTLRYWYMATYRTTSQSFTLSYEVTFSKKEASSFTLDYAYITEYYNGIALNGETAKLTGTINPRGDDYTISTEKYTQCDADEIQETLVDCHTQGVLFIEDIMKEANIYCSFEELLG